MIATAQKENFKEEKVTEKCYCSKRCNSRQNTRAVYWNLFDMEMNFAKTMSTDNAIKLIEQYS